MRAKASCSPNVRIRPHRPFMGDDPPLVRTGQGEYDPYFKECETLAEATSQTPKFKDDIIFVFGETTVVLAKPLPKLDGWQITEAGDKRFEEEALQ